MRRLLLLACALLVASIAGAQAPIGGVGGVGLTGRAGAQALASPYILCKSAVAVVTPADATEDTLYTCTVPANAMGANGRLRITSRWTYTNNANNKIMKIRFSGGAGTDIASFADTTGVAVVLETEISNRGATNNQALNTKRTTILGSLVSFTGGSTVDTTAATTIVITGQKAVAGDTLTLESVLVELLSDGT